MNRRLFTLCLLLPLQFSQAEDYQYEIKGRYSEMETDNQNFEQERYGLEGRYYFSPVDATKGPRYEAAFLNRTSHIGIGYEKADQHYEYYLDSNTSSNLGALDGVYVHAQSGWLVGAGITDGITDTPSYLYDSSGFQLLFGKYLGDNTRLTLQYHNAEQEYDKTINYRICAFGGFCNFRIGKRYSENSNEFYSLNVKHIQQLRQYYLALSLSYRQGDNTVKSNFQSLSNPEDVLFANYTFESDTEGYGVDLAFYPNSDWRIALGYNNDDVEGFDTERYGIALQWFIIPTVAVDLGYQETGFEATMLEDQEIINVGVTLRF